MVDKDGSGTITRQEFVAFHKELKDSMRLEHRKEPCSCSAANDAIRAWPTQPHAVHDLGRAGRRHDHLDRRERKPDVLRR